MTFTVLTFLYWVALLLGTLATLTCAAIAFKLHRQLYAMAAIGSLVLALVLAAVPVGSGPSAFGIVLGMLALALAVIGGGPVAVLALDLATNSSVPPGQHGGIMVLNAGKPAPTIAGVNDPETHEVLPRPSPWSSPSRVSAGSPSWLRRNRASGSSSARCRA